ncbi:protease Do-like 2 [Corchorus olitorius]|uniref:Protease Do-like 2 n=1 Tax=Corchorus olitorius TaxID=93759 RepID=A0A1R3K8B9_9ROSI|nr:protease Do-like 2 [Corchorus olitorius]
MSILLIYVDIGVSLIMHVLARGVDCDVALLFMESEEFWRGAEPLRLGHLLHLQEVRAEELVLKRLFAFIWGFSFLMHSCMLNLGPGRERSLRAMPSAKHRKS